MRRSEKFPELLWPQPGGSKVVFARNRLLPLPPCGVDGADLLGLKPTTLISPDDKNGFEATGLKVAVFRSRSTFGRCLRLSVHRRIQLRLGF